MLQIENKMLAVPRYWIKLTDVFEKRVFPVNKRIVKNTRTDQGTASINVDPRSKQANLPEPFPTRLAQTRILKQYNVKNTK